MACGTQAKNMDHCDTTMVRSLKDITECYRISTSAKCVSNNLLQQLPNHNADHMDRSISATARTHHRHACANLHAASVRSTPPGLAHRRSEYDEDKAGNRCRWYSEPSGDHSMDTATTSECVPVADRRVQPQNLGIWPSQRIQVIWNEDCSTSSHQMRTASTPQVPGAGAAATQLKPYPVWHNPEPEALSTCWGTILPNFAIWQ